MRKMTRSNFSVDGKPSKLSGARKPSSVVIEELPNDFCDTKLNKNARNNKENVKVGENRAKTKQKVAEPNLRNKSTVEIKNANTRKSSIENSALRKVVVVDKNDNSAKKTETKIVDVVC